MLQELQVALGKPEDRKYISYNMSCIANNIPPFGLFHFVIYSMVFYGAIQYWLGKIPIKSFFIVAPLVKNHDL